MSHRNQSNRRHKQRELHAAVTRPPSAEKAAWLTICREMSHAKLVKISALQHAGAGPVILRDALEEGETPETLTRWAALLAPYYPTTELAPGERKTP